MSTKQRARPRLLTDTERARLDEFTDNIHYSDRYGPPSPTVPAHSAVVQSDETTPLTSTL